MTSNGSGIIKQKLQLLMQVRFSRCDLLLDKRRWGVKNCSKASPLAFQNNFCLKIHAKQSKQSLLGISGPIIPA